MFDKFVLHTRHAFEYAMKEAIVEKLEKHGITYAPKNISYDSVVEDETHEVIMNTVTFMETNLIGDLFVTIESTFSQDSSKETETFDFDDLGIDEKVHIFQLFDL